MSVCQCIMMHALWCIMLLVIRGWELANSGDPECLGIFYGLIGKVDFQGEGEARLLLVKETDPVGALPDGREVVKIRSIAFLHICGPDVTNAELGLRPCKKHKGGSLNVFELPQKASLAKTWGSIKSATSSIKNTTQHAAAMATYQVKSGLKKEIKEKEKFEKRILDELSRIFTDTDSFYFCVGPPGSKQCDLTNCLQRQSSGALIDDRFFWNKYMLKEILEMNNDLARAWVLPVIQGYVQIEHCNLEVDPLAFGSQRTEFITVGIISRRSRYRAGTRYKRRGLDEDGKCANYVETEQFLATADHHISFIMVRGSVPLFWSQPGFKYRPPPHIDKGEAETKLAFEKHMNEELQLYGPVCIVNLVEQTGKENIIWEGFTEQVMNFDSPLVTYATFDFHEHCRGMKFENVSYLIARLEDPLQEMGFCWKDEQGLICRQNGIFRVNCIDCLDRTNVVQTALGKAVLETQLTKLGLLSPEGVFPVPLRSTFQLLWANNGDIISKQYAGTNALKGDYTRTGERKLTGMMKDGMNSANRYLRRVLLDDLRQLSIEVCMGYELSPLTYSSTLAYEFLDVVSTQDYSCPSTYVERELLLGIAVYNFSRNCFELNGLTPATGGVEHHGLPIILYVHGESYEWNSGNPYDGSVLASYGHLIVVTINYRLGILGFLKTGARGSAQGNFGLMDLVAGLHWLRENMPAFGGDPDRITLMGHGTGAALANFIAVSPVAKELLHRVVLLSGSGLSPWALQKDPLGVTRRVAEKTGCHGELLEEDIAPCLRSKPLRELMAVHLDPPRFLPGFAPFADGAVLSASMSSQVMDSGLNSQERHGPAYQLSDFPDRDLLFGVTSTESYLDLSAQDLEYGFNETRRDRILRTYVRNSYYFHLNEIFSTLKNEYTDWERPVQNPLNVRDSTLEVLSDGHTVAPLVKLGYLHAIHGGRTYFMHFHHQSTERDFPQRTGSVRGEDVPYVMGLPLVGGLPFFPHNYTSQDVAVSKQLIHYLANFARKGDPNGPTQSHMDGDHELPIWDTYDSINQLYLQLGFKSELKNHYRGHKMSLWLNLIPQLHQPGLEELSMRHHHFQEEGAQYYDGSVRPQTLQRPVLVTAAPSTTTTTTTTEAPATSTLLSVMEGSSTECPPNSTQGPAARPATNSNSLLRKLASSHYQSYTTALTVTIAVGCFLLLLNILIFAGIYHQRDRREGGKRKSKKEDLGEGNSCSSSSEIEGKQALAESIVQQHMVELQEFKCSPPSGSRGLNCSSGYPPGYMHDDSVLSPSIPEPPPPPKAQAPAVTATVAANQAGILRAPTPQTPNTMKKRVQIQEISV